MSKADDFVKAINYELEQFAGYTNEQLIKAVDAGAKQAAAELRVTSPKSEDPKAEDPGAYARDWTYKKAERKTSTFIYGVVYNKKHYMLVHLLEYGHLVFHGKNAGQRTGAQNTKERVDAIPHVATAEKNAVDTMERVLKEGFK